MAIMNVALLLALTGCLALLAGLFGGVFKAEQVEIPKISGLPRFISGLIGLVLIGAAAWLYVHPVIPSAPQPTEVAKEVALSSTEPASPATFTPQPPTPAASEPPTLAITATLPPATPILPDPKTPPGALDLYFSELSRGDYGDAWQQLTWKYQQKNYPNGSLQFRNYWITFKTIDLNSAPAVINGNSADCTVDATFHTKSGGTNQVTGVVYHMSYDLAKQMWLIDAP